MGNSEYRGGFRIDTETSTVVCGGEVTGVVHFLIREPSSVFTIELSLMRKEFTQWTDSGRTYSGKSNTEEMSVALHHFGNGKCPPNKYSFPFVLQIPVGCSSSFNYEEDGFLDKTSTTVRIVHQLKATVKGDSSFFPGKAPLRVLLRPTLGIPMDVEQQISVSSCFTDGKIKIKLIVDKNVCHPGDTLKTFLNIDEKDYPSTTIGYNISFVQTILMRDDNNTVRTIATLLSRGIVQARSGPRTMPSEELVAITLRVPLENRLMVLPTAHGKKVDCTYTVRVDPVLNDCCEDMEGVKLEVVVVPEVDGERGPREAAERAGFGSSRR